MNEIERYTTWNASSSRDIQGTSLHWERVCKKHNLSFKKHVEIKIENLYPIEKQRITVFVSDELKERINRKAQEQY